jgi:hypothetical protein
MRSLSNFVCWSMTLFSACDRRSIRSCFRVRGRRVPPVAYRAVLRAAIALAFSSFRCWWPSARLLDFDERLVAILDELLCRTSLEASVSLRMLVLQLRRVDFPTFTRISGTRSRPGRGTQPGRLGPSRRTRRSVLRLGARSLPSSAGLQRSPGRRSGGAAQIGRQPRSLLRARAQLPRLFPVRPLEGSRSRPHQCSRLS